MRSQFLFEGGRGVVFPTPKAIGWQWLRCNNYVQTRRDITQTSTTVHFSKEETPRVPVICRWSMKYKSFLDSWVCEKRNEFQKSAPECTAQFQNKNLTSGQSSLTKDRIAGARGQFSGIRQVAPMYIPSNTCFLGPTRVHNPSGISIGATVSAGLTIVTDRPTDRPRYSVCNNRPHLL